MAHIAHTAECNNPKCRGGCGKALNAYRQAANELAIQAGIIKEPVTDGGVLGEWYWVELLREVVERERSQPGIAAAESAQAGVMDEFWKPKNGRPRRQRTMSETQDNQKAAQVDAQRPPLSDLLPCPRCKNKTWERTSIHDDQCCISCKCGYMGPVSEFGEEAEFLWNNLAR